MLELKRAFALPPDGLPLQKLRFSSILGYNCAKSAIMCANCRLLVAPDGAGSATGKERILGFVPKFMSMNG